MLQVLMKKRFMQPHITKLQNMQLLQLMLPQPQLILPQPQLMLPQHQLMSPQPQLMSPLLQLMSPLQPMSPQPQLMQPQLQLMQLQPPIRLQNMKLLQISIDKFYENMLYFIYTKIILINFMNFLFISSVTLGDFLYLVFFLYGVGIW